MVSIDWEAGQGWHDAQVRAYGPLTLDPASAVLHYAQEIFEGLGLPPCRRIDRSFRPEANGARLQRSAHRRPCRSCRSTHSSTRSANW